MPQMATDDRRRDENVREREDSFYSLYYFRNGFAIKNGIANASKTRPSLQMTVRNQISMAKSFNRFKTEFSNHRNIFVLPRSK